MELRQLEYFVAVAEEASFTRAAARVHISQSGVSAQIRELEQELGQILFDRSSRNVRLTGVGAALLPHARAALDAAASARQVIAELAGLVQGQVSVGMVNGCSLPVLAELLAQFHRQYPGVAISLREASSDQLVDSLREGNLDLAMIGAAGMSPPGIEGSVLLDDALVAVVHEASTLARRSSLRVAGLRGQELICLPRGTGARAALDAACAAAGFAPRVAFEASALAMIVHLASLGLGVGVVPASTAQSLESQSLGSPSLEFQSLSSNARILPIVRPPVRSRLELVWAQKDSTHPAARALVEHARRFLSQLEADPISRRVNASAVPTTSRRAGPGPPAKARW